MFVTQGSVAGLYIIMARTGTGDKRHHGISAFLVEAGTKGLQIGQKLKKMGCRGSDTTSLVLKDVEVPAGALFVITSYSIHYTKLYDPPSSSF